jgi:hypothetical protein
MNLRKDFTYSLVVPTSMGVRITPANGQPVHSSDTFTMQATSAETNVASISSYLGLPVKVLTTFVKGSPIAQFIKNNLAGRHMAYEGKELPQGGPWGYRHQFNIADSGYGSRGPRVQNDRAGEVGRTLNEADETAGKPEVPTIPEVGRTFNEADETTDRMEVNTAPEVGQTFNEADETTDIEEVDTEPEVGVINNEALPDAEPRDEEMGRTENDWPDRP